MNASIQSTAGIRRYNRKLVLSEIYRRGRVSRTRLAASTSLTATAITRITRELIAAGMVVEGDQLASQRSARQKGNAIIDQRCGGACCRNQPSRR